MDLITLAGHSKTIVSITTLDSTVFGQVQLSELKKATQQCRRHKSPGAPAYELLADWTP